MKKILMATAAVVAFTSVTASADAMKGFYVGLKGAFQRSTAGESIATNVGKKNANAFYGQVFVGHTSTFGKVSAAGELGFGYSTLKQTLAEQGSVGAYYKPRFEIEVAGRVGMFMTENVMGFVRLGVDVDFSRGDLKYLGTTHYRRVVWSLKPGLGVMGSFNEQKWSWMAGVDYKMAISNPKIDDVKVFKKKPASFDVYAGLVYHI